MSITQTLAAWFMSAGFEPVDAATLAITSVVAVPVIVLTAVTALLERRAARHAASIVVAVVVDGRLSGATRLSEWDLNAAVKEYKATNGK